MRPFYRGRFLIIRDSFNNVIQIRVPKVRCDSPHTKPQIVINHSRFAIATTPRYLNAESYKTTTYTIKRDKADKVIRDGTRQRYMFPALARAGGVAGRKEETS